MGVLELFAGLILVIELKVVLANYGHQQCFDNYACNADGINVLEHLRLENTENVSELNCEVGEQTIDCVIDQNF